MCLPPGCLLGKPWPERNTLCSWSWGADGQGDPQSDREEGGELWGRGCPGQMWAVLAQGQDGLGEPLPGQGCPQAPGGLLVLCPVDLPPPREARNTRRCLDGSPRGRGHLPPCPAPPELSPAPGTELSLCSRCVTARPDARVATLSSALCCAGHSWQEAALASRCDRGYDRGGRGLAVRGVCVRTKGVSLNPSPPLTSDVTCLRRTPSATRDRLTLTPRPQSLDSR